VRGSLENAGFRSVRARHDATLRMFNPKVVMRPTLCLAIPTGSPGVCEFSARCREGAIGRMTLDEVK